MKLFFYSVLFSVSLCFTETRPISLELAKKKMWKNSLKAIKEHQKKDLKAPYIQPEQLVFLENCFSLAFSYEFAEEQGLRLTMEDAHFFKEVDQGVIMGVLDGHGGDSVARYASQAFQDRFSDKLNKMGNNVHQTFSCMIDEIHQEVEKHREWNEIGSTAVLCFIDKNTNEIFTATLGDSEANIYRKINGKLKSIPLSCVRDWSSEKDAKRASKALNNPKIAELWPKEKDPKRLRYPYPYGVNVSRAIGDIWLSPAVIHKPKITRHQVQEGDILILACDGLKDYVLEEEIISLLEKEQNKGRIAQRLIEFALYEKSSFDNVTIIVAKAKRIEGKNDERMNLHNSFESSF